MRSTKNSTARKLWNLLNSQEKPVKFTIQVGNGKVLTNANVKTPKPRRSHTWLKKRFAAIKRGPGTHTLKVPNGVDLDLAQTLLCERARSAVGTGNFMTSMVRKNNTLKLAYLK